MKIPLSCMLPTVLCHLLFAVWEVTPPGLFINSVEAQQFCIQALTCAKLYDDMVLNALVAIRATETESMEAQKRTEGK